MGFRTKKPFSSCLSLKDNPPPPPKKNPKINPTNNLSTIVTTLEIDVTLHKKRPSILLNFKSTLLLFTLILVLNDAVDR